ncbi:DNA cytosine methyltransferase [Aetokthonos hydrillicola]|uniref:DNA cytosine methyltransferase n=1 Tax=Aetokthonos hydrillicola TaxID=1550245 RepID=UPI001ABA1A85|nr:DNA cytosine methyltransferase [Aetokthonos hydrillicola CCALA 1050]
MTGSPPCPPFSVEGERKGAADERDCFPAVLNIIANYQPRFAAIENVPGLLTCPNYPGQPTGSYFRGLLRTLDNIGYDAEWITISSGHFASPFIRERLLLVAVSRSLKLQWQWTTTWTDQARGAIEETRGNHTRTSSKPGISREQLQSSTWLDRSTGKQISIGIASKNGIIRDRRAALGNAFDWRVANIALKRVLYLNSLI